MADEWEQRPQLSEMQRIDQANRQRQMELNDRMQQLERGKGSKDQITHGNGDKWKRKITGLGGDKRHIYAELKIGGFSGTFAAFAAPYVRDVFDFKPEYDYILCEK